MLDSAGKRKERSPGRIAELTEEDAAARAERRGPPPRTSNSTLPFRAPASSSADDIAALKTKIASQQQQIDELRAWKQSLDAELTQVQSLLQPMVQMPQQMADVSTQLQRLLSQQQPPFNIVPPRTNRRGRSPQERCAAGEGPAGVCSAAYIGSSPVPDEGMGPNPCRTVGITRAAALTPRSHEQGCRLRCCQEPRRTAGAGTRRSARCRPVVPQIFRAACAARPGH